MTYEEAQKLLHPDSVCEAIAEIEYYCGLSGKETAMAKMNEARLIAYNLCNKEIAIKVNEIMSNGFIRLYCPKCRKQQKLKIKECYCERCGQKLKR